MIVRLIPLGSEFCSVAIATIDFPSVRAWFVKIDFEIKCLGILVERPIVGPKFDCNNGESILRYGSPINRRVGPLIDLSHYAIWHLVDDNLIVTERFLNGYLRLYFVENVSDYEIRGGLTLSKATQYFFSNL